MVFLCVWPQPKFAMQMIHIAVACDTGESLVSFANSDRERVEYAKRSLKWVRVICGI